MYNKVLLTSLVLLFSSTLLPAQSKYTISGTVTDKKNGETVIGASVYAQNNSSGSSTNTYGFYSLTLPQGKYKIIFKTIGYQSDTVDVDLSANLQLNRSLAENSQALAEIVISSRKNDDNLTSASMGTEVLNMKIAGLVTNVQNIKLPEKSPVFFV